MCGIAGLVGQVNPATRAAVGRMAGAMSHRGPDAGALWESDTDDLGRGCILAHRRLAILDLSSAADQPMTDPRGQHTIVFNGEIYNFRALRAELVNRGERFTSSGDTEVLLRWLSSLGPAEVGRARGMYSFALWNHRRRTLSLGRDPHGIKPLYVCRNPDPEGSWSLVFASEVRAILAAGLLERPRLSADAVASVVWNGFVTAPRTIVEGIERQHPGLVVEVDQTGRSVRSTAIESPPRAERSDLQGLRAELQRSVELHLESDVPLGVFLSAGVDSSVVANLAQRARPQDRIETFTLAFEDSTLNEGTRSRAIADAIGTKHHEILLTESDFVANLESALDSLDQPTFDGLNSYFMSRAVREAGLTVALAGTGGDELFGGYQSFAKLPTIAAWSRSVDRLPTPFVRRCTKLARSLFEKRTRGPVGPQTRWAKLPDMVDTGGELLALYQLSYALFLPAMQERLLGRSLPMPLGLPHPLQERLAAETRVATPLAALGTYETRLFLGERLLPESDAASMSSSLELRMPLVDVELSSYVASLDDSVRFHPLGRKAALREAGLVGLPPDLFDSPKQGFQLPFDRWIRENLGDSMDETMRDPAAAGSVGLDGLAVRQLWDAFRAGSPGLFWSRVWALYVLVRWCDKNGVAR